MAAAPVLRRVVCDDAPVTVEWEDHAPCPVCGTVPAPARINGLFMWGAPVVARADPHWQFIHAALSGDVMAAEVAWQQQMGAADVPQ